jgi:hypothetical protein
MKKQNQTAAKKSKASFTLSDWLKMVPGGYDQEHEEIVTLEISLSLNDWFSVATIASAHSESMDDCVSKIVYDALEKMDLMNSDGRYAEEDEEHHRKETEEFKKAHNGMNIIEWHDHQKAQQSGGEAAEDTDKLNDPDWWKKDQQEGGAK